MAPFGLQTSNQYFPTPTQFNPSQNLLAGMSIMEAVKQNKLEREQQEAERKDKEATETRERAKAAFDDWMGMINIDQGGIGAVEQGLPYLEKSLSDVAGGGELPPEIAQPVQMIKDGIAQNPDTLLQSLRQYQQSKLKIAKPKFGTPFDAVPPGGEPGKFVLNPETGKPEPLGLAPYEKPPEPKGPVMGSEEWKEAKRWEQNLKSGAKKQEETLDPKTEDYLASQFRITGKLPGLGMGAAGTRVQILNKAAEQTEQMGDSPENQVARQASLKAFTSELGRIQGQRGLVMSFKNAVSKNLELVRESSGQLKRSGVPIINRWVNKGRRAITGDPEVSKFDLALRTVINEFARVTTSATGGGVTSDAARKEINDLLNDAQTPEQINEVIDYMVREMKGREQGYADQIKATMQGIAAATGVGEPGAVLPKLEEEGQFRIIGEE